MPTLVWDAPGERIYEYGVDRGVLYSSDGVGVAWNGLVSVDESVSGNENSPVYFDGVKINDIVVPGDFAASLKAYTYPDEFLEFEGVLEVGNGLFAANQYQRRFGLSYRTMINNDAGGEAYKIHILYNLTAVPSQKAFSSVPSGNVTAFEWDIEAIPGEVPGFRPTAHIIIDTRKMDPLLVADIENTLYGDGESTPSLPPISTLTSFIADWVIIRITDNFDGTWTAEGPDHLITMLDATTFQIIQANAEYLDADTYVISTSTF